MMNYTNWDLTADDETISMLVREVSSLRIADVLSKYGVKVEKKVGGKLYALCPFHLDHHIGSFAIDVKRNNCWCWSCQNGGGVIDSVAKILCVDYTEAALQIAADFGMISPEQFEALNASGVKYEKKAHGAGYKWDNGDDVVSEDEMLFRNNVYQALKAVCPLLPSDRIYLIGRGVPAKRIDRDYFTMPGIDVTKAVREKYRELFHESCDPERLSGVPGFFGTVKGRHFEVTMFTPSGVGILLRNTAGLIVAIQYRDRDPEASVRYRFLSGDTGRKKGEGIDFNGASVGSPVDVIPPTECLWNGRVAVTEGKFKAEQLALKGYVAVSVQGVFNFKNVPGELVHISERYGKIQSVDVFYDADAITNPNVCLAREKLAKCLTKHSYFVRIAVWNPKFGKGIDDFILRNERHPGRFFSPETAGEAFQNALNGAMAKYGVTSDTPVAQVTLETRKGLLHEFTRLMEEAFDLA